jgi:hypothetical protein
MPKLSKIGLVSSIVYPIYIYILTLSAGSIVFVHGLHGDQAPWTSDAGVFWPEKLLPAKVPDACVLSFEYEVAIDSFFDEDDGITDVSNDLINELIDHRFEKEKVLQFNPSGPS